MQLSAEQQPGVPVAVVVDVANVMGSVPDGWWRDRRAAAERWLARLADLPGGPFPLPERSPGGAAAVGTVVRVVAVLEGQARGARSPEQVEVREAPGSGDDEIVLAAHEVAAQPPQGGVVVVVTADRGLRARLPAEVLAVGPRQLRDSAP